MLACDDIMKPMI